MKTLGWSPILVYYLGVLYAGPTAEACPNSCNGHGTCGENNICDCFDGFISADCSQRICPSAPAWADKAYAMDLAHSETECANAGICDRTTGQCECLPGFTGLACTRVRCLNDCNGRGVCMTIGSLGELYGTDYEQPGDGGDGKGASYLNWDKSTGTSCVCYAGYSGPDCSSVMCPKADDPMTMGQDYRSISVKISSTSTISGNARVTFNGYVTTFSSSSPTSECKDAFESLQNVERASCSVNWLSSTSVQYNVTLEEFPMFPVENNIHSHTGNPSIDSFTCDISDIIGTDVTCRITDLVSSNIREYVYCAARGSCDFKTGDCACFDGFTGEACTTSTYYSGSIAYLENTGQDFIGSIVELKTAKDAAVDFYMIQCYSGSIRVFSVQGDGEMHLKSIINDDGISITDGGVTIKLGGLEVLDDGMYILNSAADEPVLELVSKGGSSFTSTVLSIKCDIEDTFQLIDAGSSSSDVFNVRGDGKTTIKSGGLLVNSAGATITDGGLFVEEYGATIMTGVNKNSLQVEDEGVTIMNSNNNKTDSLLTVRSTREDNFRGAGFRGTVLHVKADTQFYDNSNPFYLMKVSYDSFTGGSFAGWNRTNSSYDSYTSIFSISGEPLTRVEIGGLDVVGGVTIADGGLNITAGGAVIKGGMVTMENDVVVDHDAKVNGKMKIHEFIDTLDDIHGTDVFLSGTLKVPILTCVYLVEYSDVRLKRNVNVLASQYSALFDLDGVSFKWRDDSNDKERFGFIAQEVEIFFPEMIQADGSGFLSISYSSFSPLFVEVLKAQKLEIQSLKDRAAETQSCVELCLRRSDVLQNSIERLDRIEETVDAVEHRRNTETRLQRIEEMLGLR